MGTSNRRSFLQAAGAAVLSGRASRLFGKSPVEPRLGSVAERGTSSQHPAFVSGPIPLRLGFRLFAESSRPDSESHPPGEGRDMVSPRHGSLAVVRAVPGLHGFRPRVPALRRGEQPSGLSAHADHGLFPAAIRWLSRCRVRQNRPAQENSGMGPGRQTPAEGMGILRRH